MELQEKLYRAMVWPEGSERPGQRITVLAPSLAAAMTMLESKYGKGQVFDLHNDEEAARARS